MCVRARALMLIRVVSCQCDGLCSTQRVAYGRFWSAVRSKGSRRPLRDYVRASCEPAFSSDGPSSPTASTGALLLRCPVYALWRASRASS
jgi:hypothetical protein